MMTSQCNLSFPIPFHALHKTGWPGYRFSLRPLWAALHILYGTCFPSRSLLKVSILLAQIPYVPCLEVQHFQNFTLKIQGQCHSWRPHTRYITLLTHNVFVRCWRAVALLYTAIKKIDLENPRSKSNNLSTHFPFVPCQSAIPFLRYELVKIGPWKS